MKNPYLMASQKAQNSIDQAGAVQDEEDCRRCGRPMGLDDRSDGDDSICVPCSIDEDAELELLEKSQDSQNSYQLWGLTGR